ncbi:alpha-L-fucosidase [Mesoplasma florum]|uniref:alpha-L-fucosidase n=1 Tax=Mesoplasma florum TaxID=2151 RepID=UPI000D02937E|nr:alpha-L-fucosidase [Mesoplasma florum]AVN58922.1 hypothetical protein CG009_01615 [Mesoplasma florum]
MEKRVKDFQKDGLGLFIHYGIYSNFEKGEWYWEMNRLSEEQYFNEKVKTIKLKANFKKIVKWAKTNGFKYIVLTAKHHDGFGLYDSKKLLKRDINWLAFEKRDIIDDFILQCNNNGIKPFIYYATMDWLKDSNLNFDDHLDNIYQNVKLLSEKYKEKICGWWFDGNWSEPEKDWKTNDLYNLIRKNNQNAIIINNTGLENKGEISNPNIDSVTFEQGKISEFKNNDMLKSKAFEVCYTLNGHWGAAEYDFDYKSPAKLINDFLEIRKYNGNFLLNIGLNKNGEVGKIEKAIINEFGKWNKLNFNDLQKEFNVVKYSDDFLLTKNSNKKYKLYIQNLKSGAHIDNIHYGNEENNIFEFNTKEKIIEITYADNKKNVEWYQDLEKVQIKLSSFDYGTNTIVRILNIKTK